MTEDHAHYTLAKQKLKACKTERDIAEVRRQYLEGPDFEALPWPVKEELDDLWVRERRRVTGMGAFG